MQLNDETYENQPNPRPSEPAKASETVESGEAVEAGETDAITLDKLQVGQSARVLVVGGKGTLRQHFLDMGIIPGAVITLVKFAPMGDPMEFTIHGYELTLRVKDAAQIEARLLDQREVAQHVSRFDPYHIDLCASCATCDSCKVRGSLDPQCDQVPGAAAANAAAANATAFTAAAANAAAAAPAPEIDHPGLGEGGRFHDRATEHPLPQETKLVLALAGNENSGKTTLFNQLTGSNQRVGNFPGITADRKAATVVGHPNAEVVDLPGIYSMTPYASEELISRKFILDEKPQGIINVVDAANIERNLYLTMQLMELDVPMVVALNMMDEVQSNGGSIRVNEMEAMLGVPVVPISAVGNQGVDELLAHALHVAHFQEKPAKQDFCGAEDNGGAVHRCLHAVMHIIEDHAEAAGIPKRFAATKVIESDQLMLDALGLHGRELEAIESLVAQMESERGLDRGAAIAEMRFSYIADVVAATVVKPAESRERARSLKADSFLTGRWTAIPAFVGIMALIFWLTFDVIGGWLQGLISDGIDALSGVTAQAMASADVGEVVQSLVLDGIFPGMGVVISFLPIIVTLFFFLSLLEDTGYMARVAFFMDSLLRKLGLSGRSIVPLLMGFGCTVPAVMASRTLPSERDRKLTILITPFMSCSTKITVYGFLTALFFPGRGAIIMIALYLLGICMGILTALVSNRTAFKGEAVPFVMELPNYRLPSARSIGRLVWEKSMDFVRNAFTVIFIAVLVIWFLQSFSPSLDMVQDASQSMLAMVAGVIAPVFEPLGLGDWRIVTALITGLMAKETVVSTLAVLFGTTGLSAIVTPSAALALMVFCLLYTPCVASISCIGRELGAKWAAGIVVYQCVIAWVCAFVVRMAALALGMA